MVSFEELYSKYYKDIYYFILKQTGYRDDLAEELTQESFYQAFISLDRFRGDCEIKSWLCQIAKNTYCKYLRNHTKQLGLEEELLPEQEGKSLSEAVEEKQMMSHLRQVIAELSERDRTVAECRLFCDMSYKEIGSFLGIREATAKVLFSRVKVKIQQRLKEEYGYEI